jgi:hypothetical protein
MAASAEIDLLLGWLHEAFDARAWHGTPLRGSLRGLDAKAAAWRPAPGRHNIWEIAVHAAYWKCRCRGRLTGDPNVRFAFKGRNWFVRPGPGEASDDSAWRRDVQMLVAEHRKLLEVVRALPPSALRRPARAHRQTPLEIIRGIAAHDVYHAGQIQMLRALARR